MRHVDLCSGIGGFSLAFEEVGLSKTIMFCDTEKWCRDILAKHWPNVPITNDVKELANDPERNVPDCDILTAGYPCQPFSVAGKQRGTEDDRHIWPYIFRIVAHKRPTWCVFENVYGHVGMGLDEVLHDLEGEGYATRTFIVPASGIGARHKRDRLWIIARTMDDTEGNRDCGDIRKLPKAYESTPQPQKQHKEKSLKPLNASANTAPLAHTGRELWGQGNTEGVSEDTSKRSASSVHNQSGSQGQSSDVAHTDIINRWAIKEPQQSKGKTRGQPTSNISGNVAHTDSPRQQQSHEEVERGTSEQPDSSSVQSRENVEYSNSNDVQGQRFELNSSQSSGLRCGEAERSSSSRPLVPELGGMADGIPTRLDGFDGWDTEPEDIPRVVTGMKGRANRLKGLGNAIVPQIAMNIARAIKETQNAKFK